MNIDQFNRESRQHAEGGESQHIRRDEQMAVCVSLGECLRCGNRRPLDREKYCASCGALMRAMRPVRTVRPLVRTIPSPISPDPEERDDPRYDPE